MNFLRKILLIAIVVAFAGSTEGTLYQALPLATPATEVNTLNQNKTADTDNSISVIFQPEMNQQVIMSQNQIPNTCFLLYPISEFKC